MHRVHATIVMLAAIVSGCRNDAGGLPSADTRPPVTYPPARRAPDVVSLAGHDVLDPYRWLEGDPGRNAEVAAWIAAQRRLTTAHLAALPGRAGFRASLSAAYDYERVSAPQKAGGRYFFTRKRPEQDQATLYMRDRASGAERVIVDPQRWSRDGTIALAEWRASSDGKHLAYAVQDRGSDWRTIRVIRVDGDQALPDEVRWARFTQIAWAKDGSGFYYSRFPEPKAGEAGSAPLSNHAIYFYRLGTPQRADKRFYATPRQPGRMNALGTTPDGRYAIIYSSPDLVRADISVADLTAHAPTIRPLIEGGASRWSVIGNRGSELFLTTDKDAPRAKIVKVDLSRPASGFADVLPEQKDVITGAYLAAGRLLVSYLTDAKSELRRYTMEGRPDGKVPVPGIGSVGTVVSEAGDPEAFFVFASFDRPNTVYHYDVAANRRQPWGAPATAADLDALIVRQIFYRSKDGTRVPMFVVKRRDVTGPAATLLTGYGAFATSMPPAYSAMLTGWLLQGGTLAIPAVRGGGEYGAAWHQAGRGATKQNSFDDFIAAAEYLFKHRIASANGLAIYGDSAGGLLIGAVVNQRPDLFAAALPSVGVMDMLRYPYFTGGRLWVGEYGDPAREPDFRTLLAYSPYHNIRSRRAYPAILVTTGEADNRVVPAHSFKYVAALQAGDLGPRPRLLRVDARAGHGGGKPAAQVIEEAADMWAFAAHWTGLKVRDAR